MIFTGGYPLISFGKNNAYNVGFNSTQAGLVSLLGNAALALGGKKFNQFYYEAVSKFNSISVNFFKG